jgi:hypothetical protein
MFAIGREQLLKRTKLHWLLCDIFNVLPELLRFIFIEDHGSIMSHPRHKDLDGHRVMPDLYFTVRDKIQV